MIAPLQEHEKATLAELETRAAELEKELDVVQTSISLLRARVDSGAKPATGKEVPLTPAWDAPIPIATPPQSRAVDATTDTGHIYLQSLQPYHPLRAKWGLGSGLENAHPASAPQAEEAADIPTATELRLFGLLQDGTAWEQRIPFTSIAGGNGITLGRDPAGSDICLDDASVSRAHLQLQLNGYGLVAVDLGSTNGSTLNGEDINAYNNYRPVQDGDTISLGNITLQVEFI